jgi:hypothetical protein
MCCENHTTLRGTTGFRVVSSARLTDNGALHQRMTWAPAGRTSLTINYTVTWAPVRAPVTKEDPIAEPVLV